MDIFSIPINEKFLIYAPLQKLTALVNNSALQCISRSLQNGKTPEGPLRQLLTRLRAPGESVPTARTGPLNSPLFLGLIPTRGCNMACRYCNFEAPKQNNDAMSLTIARNAVDAYFDLLQSTGKQNAEIHFFGGEPFHEETIVHFVVEYATTHAAKSGLDVRFEVTTNGLYNENRCRWIADHFDSVVLSLDGMPDIQDHHRPAFNKKPVSGIVIRNAKILSEGAVNLVIRACITRDTTSRMAEIANWILDEFCPGTVCFESLTPSTLAQAEHLKSPSPWEFAQNFAQAAYILSQHGIETYFSGADLRTNQVTSCPVGKDALIVSPDGAVDACYLLKEEWEISGLDMRIGWLSDNRFKIDANKLQRIRNWTVDKQTLCTNCLARYHCAGGCVVRHNTYLPPGQYDDLCIQTRLITIATLLRKIGQHDLASEWLSSQSAMEAAAIQNTDRLVAMEMTK